MKSFGKRLRGCREEKALSQQKLANELNTSHSVIGRYERDEMTPSIDVAKNMAQILDTTVGYLLGELEGSDTFKDPAMLQRLNDINNLSEEEKNCVLFSIDAILRDAKTRQAYK